MGDAALVPAADLLAPEVVPGVFPMVLGVDPVVVVRQIKIPVDLFNQNSTALP